MKASEILLLGMIGKRNYSDFILIKISKNLFFESYFLTT